MPIPLFVEPPSLSDSQLAEITEIVFGPLSTPVPCPLAFVFGGTHPEVVPAAHTVYLQGLAPQFLVTGGLKPHWPKQARGRDGTVIPEARWIVQSLLDLGVPSDVIAYEDRSTSTLENIRFALEVLDFRRLPSILCVCKTYAAGRQCRTLARHVSPTTELVALVYETQIDGTGPMVNRTNWHLSSRPRSLVFSNLLKIIRYGTFDHLLPIAGLSGGLREITARALQLYAS